MTSGLARRGLAFEAPLKFNMGDIEVRDQVDGVRWLVSQGLADPDRIGIFGWSYGGYMAAYALCRSDKFKLGIAGAGVYDWRLYDTHYTERYMDLPQNNPDGYAAASVLTYAGELKRPLLLIHGTADDNFYFMHSLKLSDALFRAGKPFEFLPLAGFTHMVPDPLVTKRLYGRVMTFFATHLAEPRGSAEP